MSARSLVMAAAGSAGSTPLYVDDVFSAYTYTGTGSAQTINNGIDLAGKGGMVWIKSRTYGDNGGILGNHVVLDSEVYNHLNTNTTNAASAFNKTATSGSALTFTSTGFTETSFSGGSYVSWTFRKAPKFFDVVTYTGNGASNRSIAHSLGVAPGVVIVKCTSFTGTEWQVWHRSLPSTHGLILNNKDPSYAYRWPSTTPDAASFYVVNQGDLNASGQTYVAYLFAHDTAADGIVQCGSATTDGNGYATVSLGWEPQYILVKRTDSASDWMVYDTARGLSYADQKRICPNLSDAEGSNSTVRSPTATGFSLVNGASATYIYLAIRRPNKPPTTGTQVYNAIARTGTGAAATVTGVGFAPDLNINQGLFGAQAAWSDRLRGPFLRIQSHSSDSEISDSTAVTSFNQDGVSVGGASTYNSSGFQYISHFFRRAPGFFDVVCYTGTGSAQTVNHSLGVAPELIFVKSRSSTYFWPVYSNQLTVSERLGLNLSDARATQDLWNSTQPSSTVFSISSAVAVNAVTATYVAYLFASMPGISKAGSYTGNGSSQTINCGFSTGARFILIKRTDSPGDWYVWDSARGIVSANDPYLSINTTAAEVTSNDSVDPDSTGFIVNQNATTNINVNGGTFLYLAIA